MDTRTNERMGDWINAWGQCERKTNERTNEWMEMDTFDMGTDSERVKMNGMTDTVKSFLGLQLFLPHKSAHAVTTCAQCKNCNVSLWHHTAKLCQTGYKIS